MWYIMIVAVPVESLEWPWLNAVDSHTHTHTLTHVEGSHASLRGGGVHGGNAGGHEVSDLLQGKQTGGGFPLLHLILDQRLQLITEHLKHRRTHTHTHNYSQNYTVPFWKWLEESFVSVAHTVRDELHTKWFLICNLESQNLQYWKYIDIILYINIVFWHFYLPISKRWASKVKHLQAIGNVLDLDFDVKNIRGNIDSDG